MVLSLQKGNRLTEGKWLARRDPASSSRPRALSGSGVGGEGPAFGGLPFFWQSCHLSRSRSPSSWGSQPWSLHPTPQALLPASSHHGDNGAHLAPFPACRGRGGVTVGVSLLQESWPCETLPPGLLFWWGDQASIGNGTVRRAQRGA